MKPEQCLSPLIILSGIFVSLYSMTCTAQNSYLERIDADKDGFISIKEAVSDPRLLAVFGKVDVNGDGKISPQELSATDLVESQN